MKSTHASSRVKMPHISPQSLEHFAGGISRETNTGESVPPRMLPHVTHGGDFAIETSHFSETRGIKNPAVFSRPRGGWAVLDKSKAAELAYKGLEYALALAEELEKCMDDDTIPNDYIKELVLQANDILLGFVSYNLKAIGEIE